MSRCEATGLDGFPRPRRWRARWIWPAAAEGQNRFALLRRRFALERVPARAVLHLTADTRYRLFVNGVAVGWGPPQSQPYFQYYDSREVTAHLRAGENVVAAVVNHLGTLPLTRGGFLAELEDERGETLLATDASWRAILSPAWRSETRRYRMNQATPFQEMHDARLLPPDWNGADLDDAAWPAAQEITDRQDHPPAAGPWIRLVPRDIPDPTEEPRRAVAIQRAEECLDLANRAASDDLTALLSQPGRPLETSRLEEPAGLLAGEPVRVQGSTGHLDGSEDGIHDPCVVLDFGRVITAWAEIEIEAPAGAAVEFGYAERLIDGHFVNSIEGLFADRCTLRGGRQVYRPFTWKAFRYLKVRFRGFERSGTVHDLRAVVTTYPYEERGRFRSEDETLNRAWEISRATLRLCSHECLMDTPWREQAQWLGDVAAVTVPGIRACFGDDRLISKFFRQTAANQLPTGLLANISNATPGGLSWCIPDYSLWWLMALWDHYLHTGERRWAEHFYPAALRIWQAHQPYLNERGLVERMPLWLFIDWAPVQTDGECCPYNAILYGALEALGKLAAANGDDRTVGRLREVREAMRASFQPRFFDADRGLFVDACVDGERSAAASEHASAAALCFGLCDEAAAARVIRGLYEERTARPTAETQPFFTAVVLAGLQRAGRFDLALEVIRRRWGRRMVARGLASTAEEWTTNGSWRDGPFKGFLRSLSHAWSAAPSYVLIRDLIGLEIASPGAGRIRLRPQATDFEYDAAYPLRQGEVRVGWHGGRHRVELPAGVERVE